MSISSGSRMLTSSLSNASERVRAANTAELRANRQHYQAQGGKGDSLMFRAPGLIPEVVNKTFKLPLGKSLPFKVDGDAEGKTSVSIRLAQAKQEIARRIGLGERISDIDSKSIFERLGKKFPISRTDVQPSAIEDGKIELTASDVQLLQASNMLPMAKKFLGITNTTQLPSKVTLDPHLKASLGSFKQADVLGSTEPESKNVHFTDNIWHQIAPSLRPTYAGIISQSQKPGSLVVVGGSERMSSYGIKDHLGQKGYVPDSKVQEKMAPISASFEQAFRSRPAAQATPASSPWAYEKRMTPDAAASIIQRAWREHKKT
jgi:hypothetical protein